jgi:methyl acetate hydrolase
VVERGPLALNADVSPILPELRDPDILTGFDARGQPTYIKAQAPAVADAFLRSRVRYVQPDNPAMARVTGQPIASGTTIRERHLGLLLYEPGMSWEYSPAIGFVGLMAERVSGAESLQAYME